MPRIAVLGATGWLGTAVAAQLATRSDIRLLTPHRNEVEDLTSSGLREVLEPDGDLSVINCVGVIRGDDVSLTEANLTFVESLVEALDGSSAHLVQLGSAAEYGDPGSTEPISEEVAPDPLSLYGRTKWQATQLVLQRDDWCVMRPFNGIDAEMTAINPLREIREKVRSALAAGGPVELWSASTVRDHVSRGFLARSLAAAALDRRSGTFNLCSGIGLSYREVTEAMSEAAGARLEIRDLQRETGIPAVVGDPRKWGRVSALSEGLDARQVAELVMAG